MGQLQGELSISAPEGGALLARIERKGVGPCVAAVRGGKVYDVTCRAAPTARDICEAEDPAAFLNGLDGELVGSVRDVFENSVEGGGGSDPARFLAPIDLQTIKACGVTFARSMLERVIEERASGDPAAAEEVRARLGRRIGASLDSIVPGTKEAEEAKKALIDEGLWSQYLEVGIGPYPEIFSKASPMSAVGPGARVGVRPDSNWSNPEPELVLVANSKGRIVGVALGNDVNLRDFEGRSALLLGYSKDNNASCAVGPFVRLFDGGFNIEAARQLSIVMRIEGRDGFSLEDECDMSLISRDPEVLIRHAADENRAYPDGLALFCGTPFAPIADRGETGGGFTHHVGDIVTIAASEIGTLSNEVALCRDCEQWTFAASHLMRNLAGRSLI